LGKQLQQQRQLLGLTLEDVERHTHLRVFYLRALESGSLDTLHSPVQARGMLNNYATFLGMDPEPILLHFADGLQAQLAGKQATRPIKSSRKRSISARSPLRRFLSGEIIVVTFLIVALVSVVAWVAVRVNSIRTGQQPSPTVVSIAEALLPTDAPAIETTPEESIVPTELRPGGAPPATPEIEAEQIPTEETETTEETQLPPESQGAIQVNIIVGQRAWMRVIADGEIEYEGRVLPGSAYTFSGDEIVELLTGNGAALQVVFNQQDLGTLGIYGEVVQVIFTPEGILQPTPTINPTGTPAPEPTATTEVIEEP
jgi:cytoskeleton protein RodZ